MSHAARSLSPSWKVQLALTFNVFNSGCGGTVGIIIDGVVVLLSDGNIVTIEFNLLAYNSK